MNQTVVNSLHFAVRTLLTASLFFFILNTALDEKFMSNTAILIALVLLFLVSATIEINLQLTWTFWIELKTRLMVFSSFWLFTLYMLLFYSREDMMFILLIINSIYLFSLLREWRASKAEHAENS
ncbi:hypothetical protein [Planococcus salinus]|uniref:Uncharacterized protein n=1 Tax=Planococcus salinus TaxID=1848460 RepID=A0A3M8PBQ3_9BACL|nr:hypothetical protein [Planococcus salinus]RNF41139.1 hypothetical protein EEX84_01970 [Planococcus salinus]